jgi:hypothetical protein
MKPERFWKRVNKTDTCWLWTGPRLGGYGRFPGGILAHRVAWQLTNGPVPDGLKVCHRCDVMLCVNPNHLFLATQYENIQDMVRKDRHAKHKLTQEKADEIRRLYATGRYYQREIGAMYGVSQTNVYNIVNGKIFTRNVCRSTASNPQIQKS